MLIVPRHVRKVLENDKAWVENPIQPLSELRYQGAWVLLGEPGAGKSAVFAQEARATDGLWISIAEFLIDDPNPEWKGTTLFLDGLDETRASGYDGNILYKIRAHLRKLGNPRFRIACRAADWFGSTDRQTLMDVSPDGRLDVLLLDPLGLEDIQEILRQNHGIADPERVVEQARHQGIDELLNNPQTLRLLAESIKDEQWPTTRLETYQLACEKLAGEDSKQYRNGLRTQPISKDEILEAAGQLCATLLLSNRTGIALDIETSDERFPLLDDFAPPDLPAAQSAVRRKLFRPSLEAEERIEPSHRSIAEYLAARWLAERIDHQGLPLRRVLNLLLGLDNRTVAGLRGLYGWLAVLCHAARPRLIAADPLTVILYGDVKPLSLTDKRNLLGGLRQEARQHSTFHWEIPSAKPFGALAVPELADDFAAALMSPERDDASQSFTHCVLDILVEGDAIPELVTTIKAVILDESRWESVRNYSLRAWLKQPLLPGEAIALLDLLNDKKLTDSDNQLTGQLLRHLYPNTLAPDSLLSYLNAPMNRQIIGGYSMFWIYELPKIAPDSHLPVLLDQLAMRTDLALADEVEFSFDCRRMQGALLARGIEVHGETIADEQLFAWLGIGADQHGDSRREQEHRERISTWLEQHPERYKAILSLSFKHCDVADNVRYCLYVQQRRLHDAKVPEDIGLWHLQQTTHETNDELAKCHLSEAVGALIHQRGHAGLSLEMIEAWGEANPERKHWLVSLLTTEIPDWRREHAAEASASKLRQDERMKERWINLSKHLSDIRSGKAPAGLLHQLAGVWMNHYTDTRGETPLQRFESYCENGVEVLDTAEAGFFLCPARQDLPSVSEIIALSVKQREHFIRKPCLIGMELRWRQGLAFIDTLDDDKLRRMLAFRLTYGADDTPAWFTHFVQERPALLAEVLADYAGTTLKAGQSFITGIYSLANDPDYRNVALLAVPPLLKCFPVRTHANQLTHLEDLLKAALRYSIESLAELVEKKLSAKSMDVAQKVYWLTAGMLLDPPKYEPLLWQYIGKSWARANHLCTFVSDRFAGLSSDYPLSARTIGKLIELLTPHAELEQRSGFVTDAMQRGDSVRAMITRLSSLADEEAAKEIERLLALPALSKLKLPLDNARHQLKLKRREADFNFPSLAKVAQVLANRAPMSSSDLLALSIEHLDEIAYEIRHDNDDGVRRFWNVTNKKPTGKRDENDCRDELLARLRRHLEPYAIDCQLEGDYANDKRADIRLSYRNEFELPIEIKRDDNRSLWSALRKQLIEQYAIAPKALNHGIYLILWFGNHDQTKTKDGGKTPSSPEDLQARLEAQIDPEERTRIVVRVVDVSWPKSETASPTQ